MNSLVRNKIIIFLASRNSLIPKIKTRTNSYGQKYNLKTSISTYSDEISDKSRKKNKSLENKFKNPFVIFPPSKDFKNSMIKNNLLSALNNINYEISKKKDLKDKFNKPKNLDNFINKQSINELNENYIKNLKKNNKINEIDIMLNNFKSISQKNLIINNGIKNEKKEIKKILSIKSENENNLDYKNNNEIIFKFDKYKNEFINLLLTNKIGNLKGINDSKIKSNKEIKITNFNKKNLLNLYLKLLSELNYLKNINNNIFNNNDKKTDSEIKTNENNNNNKIINLNEYKNLMNINKTLIEEINILILFNEKLTNNYKKDLNFFYENINEIDNIFNL